MVKLIETVYNFLWGDLLTAPLPGGGTLPLSLLVILLLHTGRSNHPLYSQSF